MCKYMKNVQKIIKKHFQIYKNKHGIKFLHL
jgi:hypothetical protein